MTPKQKRRRDKILRTARELIEKHGYDGWSMRRLAERAGVSPTTLFNRYKTKQRLVLEAMADLFIMIDTDNNDIESPLERRLAKVAAAARLASNSPRYSEVVTRVLFAADASDGIVDVLLGGPIRKWESALRAAIVQGDIDENTDIKRLASAIVGANYSCNLRWLTGYVVLADIEAESLYIVTSMLKSHATQRGVRQIEAITTRLLDRQSSKSVLEAVAE